MKDTINKEKRQIPNEENFRLTSNQTKQNKKNKNKNKLKQ